MRRETRCHRAHDDRSADRRAPGRQAAAHPCRERVESPPRRGSHPRWHLRSRPASGRRRVVAGLAIQLVAAKQSSTAAGKWCSGSLPVLDRDDDTPCLVGELAAREIRGVERADDPAPAGEPDERRRRTYKPRRPVHARQDWPARAGNRDVGHFGDRFRYRNAGKQRSPLLRTCFRDGQLGQCLHYVRFTSRSMTRALTFSEARRSLAATEG